MRLAVRSYDHPHSQRLIAEAQQVYVERYGGPDLTPTDSAEFAPPGGLFLVGYLDDEPVACGGWRAHDEGEEHLDAGYFVAGDAELKRMYVAPAARGKGLARVLLAELEHSARVAGRRRLVLETGTRQPEAIGLYTSTGYRPVPKFGVYQCDPCSVCFGKLLHT